MLEIRRTLSCMMQSTEKFYFTEFSIFVHPNLLLLHLLKCLVDLETNYAQETVVTCSDSTCRCSKQFFGQIET